MKKRVEIIPFCFNLPCETETISPNKLFSLFNYKEHPHINFINCVWISELHNDYYNISYFTLHYEFYKIKAKVFWDIMPKIYNNLLSREGCSFIVGLHERWLKHLYNEKRIDWKEGF